MSRKNIIYYFILFSLVIVAMNLKSILNLYQNIFYTKICNKKFCIKKPNNYIIISTIQNGVRIPSIPITKPKKTSNISDNGIVLADKNFKDIISLTYLNDTKITIRIVKKYKLKKDQNIKECYNATRLMNNSSKMISKISLFCVNKKIRIDERDKIDYKTLQDILDSLELKE